MISNHIDLPRWRRELQVRGRVQVPAYLQDEAASGLHHCLAHEVPWTLAYREHEQSLVLAHAELAALSPPAYAARLRELAEHARGRYGFAYESYMMIDAYQEGRDPDLVLNTVVEFLNSEPYLAFARELTGEPRIRKVSAQATRYRPGHFLRKHDDTGSQQQRRYAYVINLTTRWMADWGGLLQFTGPDGAVLESFLPRANSLSLFRVPTDHLVTPVAPWAEEDRLSITGWLES